MAHVQLIDEGVFQPTLGQKLSNTGAPLILWNDVRCCESPLLFVSRLLPFKGNKRDLIWSKHPFDNASGRHDLTHQ